jgi:rhodanese-related sulfurtransferase
VEEIDPDQLRERLPAAEAGALRIVDVRSPEAFERGHIPGSENVPFDALPSRVERFEGAEDVVTVCPHGEASLSAARLIGAYEGVDDPVRSLAGGLAAWEGPLEEGEVDDVPGPTTDAPF